MDNPQWEITNEEYIREARVRLRQVPCTFVLGSGVSASAGLPQWNSLLMELINLPEENYLELERSLDHSAIRMASYIIKSLYEPVKEDGAKQEDGVKKKDREKQDDQYPKVRDDIRDILYKNLKKEESPLITSLCNIISNKETRIDSVITYNFDDLVECGLESINKKLADGDKKLLENKYERVNYISVYEGNRAEDEYKLPIYHVHGFIPREKDSSEIVISESDYHKLYTRFLNWSNIEQLHAFYRTTCFFVGLSMNDPNLRRLLENAYKEGGCGANHYAILERERVFQDEKLNDESILTRESLLHDLGIKIIWYENDTDKKHKRVPEILDLLNERLSDDSYEKI